MNTQTTSSLPPTYMVWSIIGTVLGFLACCMIYCLPAMGTGIVAIVFSNKTKNLIQAGDIEGATKASNTAKTWNWVTTGLLILAFIAWIVYMLVFGVSAFSEIMQQINQGR